MIDKKESLVEVHGDWYERLIEEPVRELVRHLRNNGVNTTCSCGHEMYIECELLLDGSLKELHDLLFNYLCERKQPVTYKIEYVIECVDGKLYDHAHISFGGDNHA